MKCKHFFGGDSKESEENSTQLCQIRKKVSKRTFVDFWKLHSNSCVNLEKFESKEKLLEFISKHLFEREFYYSMAENTITCDDKSVDQISDQIIKILEFQLLAGLALKKIKYF